jgi:hypothetical protein
MSEPGKGIACNKHTHADMDDLMSLDQDTVNSFIESRSSRPGSSMDINSQTADEMFRVLTDEELVARTIKPLFERYGVSTKTGAFSSLVEIVISIAGHQAMPTMLNATAIQQMSNIIQLRDYTSKNYDMYMNRSWGQGYVFTVAQSIDDFIYAYREFGYDFHPSSWAHFVYHPQDIWHNDDMKELILD